MASSENSDDGGGGECPDPLLRNYYLKSYKRHINDAHWRMTYIESFYKLLNPILEQFYRHISCANC